MEWLDRGDYWEHNASQGTKEWLNSRIGRVTTTKSNDLVYNSQFSNPEKTGKIIAGVLIEVFKPKNIEAMKYGTEHEEEARKYYIHKTNNKVKERNLIIPKNSNEMWLGASIDGDVIDTKGIIEIKCPKIMYKPITNYLERKEKGITQRGYRHIYDKHIHQMMQGMYIRKKEWCDYIVYTKEKVFIQRIFFNEIYWNKVFYPKLKINYIKYVQPYLKNNYPICPY